MLPGHFHIPGHSGTDVKHRKAFTKIKEMHKKSIGQNTNILIQKRKKVNTQRYNRQVESNTEKFLQIGFKLILIVLLVAIVIFAFRAFYSSLVTIYF